MIKHKEDSILKGKIETLKQEIATRDYQVIKAARQGTAVDALYPGHSAWYTEKMETLHKLEEALQQQTEAEAEVEDSA
jgi:hypothetical protein